jgi:hypothetical protein
VLVHVDKKQFYFMVIFLENFFVLLARMCFEASGFMVSPRSTLKVKANLDGKLFVHVCQVNVCYFVYLLVQSFSK